MQQKIQTIRSKRFPEQVVDEQWRAVSEDDTENWVTAWTTETESYTIQRDNQKHNIEQNKLFSINIDFHNISVDLLLLLNNVKYLLYEMPLYLQFRTDHTTGQYRKHLNNCPIYNVTVQGILSPSNNN